MIITLIQSWYTIAYTPYIYIRINILIVSEVLKHTQTFSRANICCHLHILCNF